MNSPRVLFISPQPFFTSRGSPFRVRSTVSALADLGFAVDLLVLPLGEDIHIPGVEIHRSFPIPGLRSIPIGPSWSKMVWDLSIACKAVALAAKRPYSVIHGIEEGGIVAAAIGRAKKIPYVFDMHSHMSHQLEHSRFFRVPYALKLFRQVETMCMRGSSGIITVGDELTAKVQKIAKGIPACSLQDLPLDSLHTVDPNAVKQLRKEFHTDGRPVLLYTGNFELYQGIDLLLEAFSHLVQNSPMASHKHPLLILVGGGSGSLRLVHRYQSMVNDLGLGEFVVFAGERPVHEMGAFMELADVLLSPRVAGNNPPLKIYSYMTTQKPIVATRISSHTQVLDDECAFMAEATPEAFAGAMHAALDSSDAAHDCRMARIRQANLLSQTVFSKGEFNRRLKALYAAIGKGTFPLETAAEEAPQPRRAQL